MRRPTKLDGRPAVDLSLLIVCRQLHTGPLTRAVIYPPSPSCRVRYSSHHCRSATHILACLGIFVVVDTPVCLLWSPPSKQASKPSISSAGYPSSNLSCGLSGLSTKPGQEQRSSPAKNGSSRARGLATHGSNLTHACNCTNRTTTRKWRASLTMR